MSCQSLAARAFAEPDKECGAFHRSVRFSSESRSSTRNTPSTNDADSKRENSGSMSLTLATPMASCSMTQSAPTASQTFDLMDSPAPEAACRFPKLEECAHFHYERVCLGGLCVSAQADAQADTPAREGWVCLRVRTHVSSPPAATAGLPGGAAPAGGAGGWREAADVREWTLTRSREHFLQLDDMLHRCIYDRKVSNLPNLSEELTPELTANPGQYLRLLAHYVHHFSIIADDSINCGPVLNWLQMDNRGHKLLVANEDTNSINTPAVAAGYCVRQYVSQARDEISFEVGDMISIIDMPGPAESVWWRGKRGFRVGFFPHHCVAVIGDKVPRHMTQPPPIVGSVMVSPIKPVLRKHGKLISLFRSFILSRPSRRSLKQQGILRERVFGCDLGEHLLNCGHSVPQILVECAQALESSGAPDGIYRLSGGAGLTARLRGAFDAGRAPDLSAPAVRNDPHAVASLLKTYFRELPNPLCTYQLYDSFVSAVQLQTEAERLRAVREACVKLPPPHYRTLAYLMRHLRRVSLLHEATGMTPRNVAIVWAPNLLRCPRAQPALQGVSVQAVVTEFLICYAEALFSSSQEPPEPTAVQPVSDRPDPPRPKSLPINPPTKLLSLEEARRRGKSVSSHCPEPALSGPSGPPGVSGAAGPSLKPEGHLKPKYIEVGSGPNNLPQYHTVLDLPASGGKRGLKRSPSGWRGLFTRSKQRAPEPEPPVLAEVLDDAPPSGLRPVKSCESLTSESDTLAPLRERAAPALKHHTRSSSCDSYFEPWQAEIAHMRLRLSSQERHCRMGDDAQATSLSSSPPESESCSAEPSPRRELRVDIEAANDAADRKRNLLEEQLASIGFIDGDSPRAKPIAAEKRCSAPAHSPRVDDAAKRLCTDRDSPMASLTDFSVPETVKLRERNSPRKTKNSARYSGMHHPVILDSADMKSQTNSREAKSLANSRLSWHGKDQHSTLIKIDWPLENSSVSNLTTSTINSTPITPATPNYDPLESDSEFSEVNKHTIRIKTANCNNCEREKCLKCELKGTDFERKSNEFADSLEPSSGNSTDVSYHNLNRLSAVSNSSNSEQNSDRKKDTSDTKIMTSSHESSSSFSNASLPKNSDELYECYNFARPNYINLQSSSTSKSSPSSPLKSPLKSTISITFRSPVKVKSPDYEFIDNVTPTNERDSVYEDIDLQKNLSIVEDACIPQTDASLPTQQACQPNDFDQDLIILETPTEKSDCENIDVYSQVKFFKKSIDEVNAMILESPEKEPAYENVDFPEPTPEYENINVDTLKICDKDLEISEPNIGRDEVHENGAIERDNGNIIKTLNVRELANRFESPTEQKGPFTFEKFKAEIKYPSLERKEEKPVEINKDAEPSSTSPKTYRLSKNSNARSLDENAFVKEFGNEKTYVDRRKSLEVRDGKKQSKFSPDLNLNLEEPVKLDEKPSITPTTENKISLIQRFNEKPELKNIIGFDTEKKLSRERIEKYKEERRNFLREKYSSQSFRSNPEQLTRIKIKKEPVEKECDRLKDDLPKFERRNTVDLGQRMRFSLARSANNLDTIPSPTSPVKEGRVEACTRRERKEKMSPTYNIRDMAAMFEQQSHNSG